MGHQQTNWAKTATWHPQEIATPSTLDELRGIILSAKSRNLQVRPVGSLHSFNDLCVTTGIQLHTHKLCQILSLDKENLKIRVEAGIKEKNLIDYLAKHNLALPNQSYVLPQSIAGLIGTATHGSGNTGTLSSFVEEIELIDANGHLHILNPSQNPHLFNAAVVGLGCLGVVYALTLRIAPLWKVELSFARSTLAKVLNALPHQLKNFESTQLYLNPYRDEIMVWRTKRTDAPLRHYLSYQLNLWLRQFLATLSLNMLSSPSFAVPLLPRIYFKVFPLGTCVDYAYRIISPKDDVGSYVEEEIAVPLDVFPQALQEAKEIVTHYQAKHRNIVVVIVCRFVQADRYGYLSPTLNRPSVYITYLTIPKPGYSQLFQEFENAMLKYKGRPHWGKIHTLTRQTVTQLYGENHQKFMDARKKLDPQGLFSNEYINNLF